MKCKLLIGMLFTAVLAPAWAEDLSRPSQPRKFQAALESATEPLEEIAPEHAPRPPRLKVLIQGDAPASEMLNQMAIEPPVDLNGFKTLLLPRELSAEQISTIVRTPGVVHVDIARPKNVGFFAAKPFNLDARISHRVPQFETQYGKDWAKNITLAVFDGGAIRATHIEFASSTGSRVVVNTTAPLDEHATHVAGTIAASGVFQQAQGMAPNCRLQSYDFQNDLRDLSTLSPDVRITNHSYGPVCGWDRDEFGAWRWWGLTHISQTEDVKFGKYGLENVALDDFLASRPELISIVAAGNDRGDATLSQPITHWAIGRSAAGTLQWQRSTRRRPQDGDTTGIDTISGHGLCKNTICIGAIHDIGMGGGIQITDFSGVGPDDVGRVKPDLVANGFVLESTSAAEDDAYLSLSGTSMATPTASGICALLTDFFHSRNSRWPLSSEIKAILIHSADDAGEAGPDVFYGWGSVNALRAARVIDRRDAVYELIDVPQADVPIVWKLNRSASTTGPVRVTAVWIDPAPKNDIITTVVDDPTNVLVNNIDVALKSPAGVIHHPYRLDPASPLAPARQDGPNIVDNVEVVDAVATPGDWTLSISGAGVMQGMTQKVAIVVSGLEKQ